MKKRILSLLTVLCMLLTMIPSASFAAARETPCPDGDACQDEAAIDGTHYPTLNDAVNAVDKGQTIRLLKDITLADDAQIRIVCKGEKENPITLDFNGKTITGNNSNTDKPNKATAKSGILFLDGCYINLVDTSTAGTKGGVVNNTTATSGMVSALVVMSYSATSSDVTINDGLRFEADKGASARGIYHYRGSNAEIYLTINDAYVSSGGYVLDCARLGGSGEVVINGGAFISKKGNNSSPLYGEATLKINGGTFHNWNSSNIAKVTDGHTISMAESDGKYIYTVISEENAPADYVASMQTSGKTVYMTAGSDLYAFDNIQSLDKQTIHVAKDVACNIPEKFAIGNRNSGETNGSVLKLELEDGVKLTGSVSLYSADVIVKGSGDTSGFSCVPANDQFEMTVNGENGTYSCRMKADAGGATLVKTDGTKTGYSTVGGAISAADDNPGSVVVMNKNGSSTSTTKLGESVDVTLDLNGYNYTFTGTKKDGFQLTNGAKLKIINSDESKTGTFIATGVRGTKANSAILTKNPGGGTIVIGENVTVKGPIVLLGEGSEVTVAGTVDATGLQEFAISGNGTAGQGNTKITIKDTAVIKSDSNCPAIYHPQSGTLTVEGGTIQGGTGIQMCSGDLVISGNPTITATGTPAPESGVSSGSIPDGAAISIVNRDYPGGTPSLTITGTPLVKANSGVDAVQAYTYNSGETPKVQTWANVKDYVGISGGYYTNDVTKYCVEGKMAVENTDTNKDSYAFKIGDVVVQENVEVKSAAISGETAAVVANKIAPEDNTDAQITAKSVSAEGLTVDTVSEDIQKAENSDALVKLRANGIIDSFETTKTVTVVRETYLDVEITAYSNDAKNPAVTLEIEPKYNLIATIDNVTQDTESDSLNKSETIVIAKGKPLTVINPINITVKLPDSFTAGTAYIKHTKADDANYIYTGTVAEVDGTKKLTFTNPNGFSTFMVTATNPAAATITDTDGNVENYDTLQDAVNAVQDGQTITLQNDVTEDVTVSRTVSFKLEPNRKTFSGSIMGGKNTTADAGNPSNGNGGTYSFTYKAPGSGSGSSAPTYAVTVPSDVANGTVSVNPKNAAKDKDVTITVKPNEGYVTDSVKVTDKDGKEVVVKDNGDGAYTFKMPASAVDVAVSFKKAAHVCPAEKFTDVNTALWYHEGIDYVLDHGMMNGVSDTSFVPDAATTRGMIVTILYRLEGEPAASSTLFHDVAADQYYTDAVSWAAANNIVNGYGNGYFGPNDIITREQMAAILYRYAAYKGYDVTARADLSGYADANRISPYAADAMAWTNAEGLITGIDAVTLNPAGSATRAQVAAILMRFCESAVK